MNASWVLSLPEGAKASRSGAGDFTIEGWYERIVLHRLTNSLQAALERLAHPGDTVQHLTELLRGGESGELARFTHYVRRLAGRGLLRMAVRTEDGPLVTLVPTSRSFDPTDRYVQEGRYVLSRFAYVHRVESAMILESPLSAARVVLEDQRIAQILLHMSEPVTATEIRTESQYLTVEVADALLSLLAAARVISSVADDGMLSEDKHESLRMWEFHDLLFHVRSRLGRHDAPSGGTFSWVGVVEQPPATLPVDRAAAIPLFRPSLEQLERDDPPFARVVEQRCSLREFGHQPITVEQLGEFLYRVARVKTRFHRDVKLPTGELRLELTLRPYPSAGALYELEIYLAVQHCDGISPGMYHYDPLDHQLTRVSADEQIVEELWTGAAGSAEIESRDIQVLLILAARFPRITWKYSTLAYSAILKHVGVLMESMYLTATAMNLAPCALGTGDSDVFTKAIGSDYYAETSVGEFLLGSCPDSSAASSP